MRPKPTAPPPRLERESWLCATVHGLSLVAPILCLPLFLMVDASAAPTHVLDKSAGSQLSRMLRLQEGLPDGRMLSAEIAKDHIIIRALRDGVAERELTLVHPKAKNATADVFAGLALARATHEHPKDLVAAVRARMEASKETISWTHRGDADPEPPKEAASEARSPADLADVFSAIEHKIVLGERAQARRMMSELPPNLDDWSKVEVAYFWVRLGSKEKAEAALADAGPEDPTFDLARDILAERPVSLAYLDDPARAKKACGSTVALHLLGRLKRTDEAIALASKIRAVDPSCVPAWEEEIRLLVAVGKEDEARGLGEKALQIHPESGSLFTVMAYVYQAMDDLDKAVEFLDKATRQGKPSASAVRNLLGTVLRKKGQLGKYLKTYMGRVKADPNDSISRLVAGVILHYENRFEESQEFLLPLEKELGHADRLHVYLAMNSFNMGRRDEALERLNRVAEGPAPDPDVFYCRAEILRDTDREQAKDDLSRYRRISEGRMFSNPEKDERIRTLTALIDACIADGRAECEGPWEHPRLRHEGRGALWQHPIFLAASLLFLLGSIVLYRSRRP